MFVVYIIKSRQEGRECQTLHTIVETLYVQCYDMCLMYFHELDFNYFMKLPSTTVEHVSKALSILRMSQKD